MSLIPGGVFNELIKQLNVPGSAIGNNNQVLLVFKESIEATNHPRSPKPTREITFGRKATTNSKTKLTSGEDSVSEWKTTTK
ncbi:unnamed protein product, partial [Allacma fusca]